MTAGGYHDEAAAFALGAVSDHEQSAMEAAMVVDASLATEVAQFREVAALLSLAAPALQPPAGLKERITARERSSAARVWQVTTPQPQIGRFRMPAIVPWLAAAASLIGVFSLRSSLASERGVRVAMESERRELETALTERDALISTLISPDVELAKLVASGSPPSARMYWNRGERRVVLAAWQMTPSPRGRTYQLWGIAQGKLPVSLGTFSVSVDGTARASFAVPEGLEIAIGAVTDEPEGGSAQPTTTPFLAGKVAGI